MASNTGGVIGSGFEDPNFINDMSVPVTAPRTVRVQPKEEVPVGREVDTTTDKVGDLSPQYKGSKIALAGAGFMAEIYNANSAYNATTGQARLNIMQARNQASDAISRGRQAQLDRQSEGFNAGEQSALAMAAQGQDVSGAGAQKVRGSYEAIGIYNGMKEEINSMREALGYELEEINYDYQIDMAGIQRTNSYISSGMSFLSSAAAIGAK